MDKILENIKKFDTIIIHGHVRPDGDCIGSQYGLKYLIEESFPKKNVYVTGDVSEYVSFIGRAKIIDEKLFYNALCICVDCPSIDRLSDNRCSLAQYSIKIDHHYDSVKYTDYEYVDSNAASATQIITEFYMKFKNELVLNEKAATALYVGLLTDTGWFQNLNVTSKTFLAASELLNHGVDISGINNLLNLENEKVLRFRGYCLNNFKITSSGFAYLVIKTEDIEKFCLDEEKASSFITSISTMEECPVWALIIETKDNIRIRLRSRGPVVNELASIYKGGGHKFASGASLDCWNELDKFINDADALVKEYKKLN